VDLISELRFVGEKVAANILFAIACPCNRTASTAILLVHHDEHASMLKF